MAIVLGTIHNTSKAVDTDLFSSPFTYTASTDVRPAPMKKIIIQIAVATGGSNLRALIGDGSTVETVILGTLTTAQVVYNFELLWRSGDTVDLQYNGISGPMDVNMKVLQSDDIQIYGG